LVLQAEAQTAAISANGFVTLALGGWGIHGHPFYVALFTLFTVVVMIFSAEKLFVYLCWATTHSNQIQEFDLHLQFTIAKNDLAKCPQKVLI
jgi:hypothetical protein